MNWAGLGFVCWVLILPLAAAFGWAWDKITGDRPE